MASTLLPDTTPFTALIGSAFLFDKYVGLEFIAVQLASRAYALHLDRETTAAAAVAVFVVTVDKDGANDDADNN